MLAVMETFTLSRRTTPIGTMLILTDRQERVRALDWDDHAERLHCLLRRGYAAPIEVTEGKIPSRIGTLLDDYFAGRHDAIDAIPVETGGTPFQRAVWAALRRIPVGRPISYGALAASIDRPSAVRAVGLANGSNPVGVIVPCHRVIGADGSLTGYAGGLERKRWLLAHEAGR